MKHGDYLITYNPKPIPSRQHDWDWCHQDYDGPGDPRCGTAPTEQKAKEAADNCEAGFDTAPENR